MQERLQKTIARTGLFSRRKAEELIKLGKVFVDGKKVTELGTKVDPSHSTISVAGKKIPKVQSFQYLLFHKPRGCLVTKSDPEGRKTIYDYLPKRYHHLNPVGRLDYHSEGLVLLTNDGELANKISHPRHHFEKVYEIKVEERPTDRQLDRLRNGIMLDGRVTLPAEVTVFYENPKSTWIRFVLKEGRNRQVRRMCEEVGLTLKTLVRTKLGPYKLTGIPYGKWAEI